VTKIVSSELHISDPLDLHQTMYNKLENKLNIHTYIHTSHIFPVLSHIFLTVVNLFKFFLGSLNCLSCFLTLRYFTYIKIPHMCQRRFLCRRRWRCKI